MSLHGLMANEQGIGVDSTRVPFLNLRFDVVYKPGAVEWAHHELGNYYQLLP